GGRPITSMRAALHFATRPGTVSAIVVQRALVLLSPLTIVPAATMPSLLVATPGRGKVSMLRSVLTACALSAQRGRPPSAARYGPTPLDGLYDPTGWSGGGSHSWSHEPVRAFPPSRAMKMPMS